MRALKIATIAMGVLILLGTTVVVVTIVRRTMFVPAGPDPAVSGRSAAGPFVSSPHDAGGSASDLAAPPSRFPDNAFNAVLEEPAGTGIAAIASVRDRLAVQLRGGGADRVLLIDPTSGAVVGRISLPR